ncbi:hypothetical protein VTL71DRAFT_12893 [Oculimacula yallundae]|uniref:Uncharacterized protein n=1 Tax=Oculimacula yallundae TaxID=86028 RepID=A0ABR4CNR1_9HELO
MVSVGLSKRKKVAKPAREKSSLDTNVQEAAMAAVRLSDDHLLTQANFTMSSSNDKGKDGAREDSLEREFAYEDATMAAGKRSKEKRDEAKDEKDREREAERQKQMREAMLRAGRGSKERRKK